MGLVQVDNVGTFVIALVVVTGSFAFFLIRGADPVITPILAVAIGTVLSYFFAQHISNGAARAALDTLVQNAAVTKAAIAAAADKTQPGA